MTLSFLEPDTGRSSTVARSTKTQSAPDQTLILRDILLERIRTRKARIGILGLGYVGLPLACLFAEQGFQVTGFDTDASKIETLNDGRSYIELIASERIGPLVASGRLAGSGAFERLREVDAIIICVPTPLTRHREPDLQYVAKTGAAIAESLRPGQIVVLESSTYPGTTRDVLKPLLEARGLKSGKDIFLAYSPEREDPGNAQFGTSQIPKVVGGDCAMARDIATALYGQVVVRTVPVGSLETAELVKLSENIFRAVNIALANELKVICTAMGIDIWEVIEAAATKPFGFMPFYPGPGLGGHCIPIDPFYLTWKAREFGINTKFIELAGEVNAAMPQYVVDRLGVAMNDFHGRAIRGARILLLGLAYKKNVDDLRESPALAIFELLLKKGADVSYHDPHIPVIRPTREHAALSGFRSRPLTVDEVAASDAVVIVTDHQQVDYEMIANTASLVIDTRNAMARTATGSAKIVKA